MTPARGNLLVREVRAAATFAGGRVLIPDAARARLTALQAEVVAVGAPAVCEDDDCGRAHVFSGAERLHPCEVAVGDWVVVTPRAGIETDAPERRERVLAQDDVIAVLRA